MGRRLAIVALLTAATVPAAPVSLDARARQAPAASSSPSARASGAQQPSAPPAQPAVPPPATSTPTQKPATAPQTAPGAVADKTAAEPGTIVFASNAGMVFSAIKPDQTGAYEEVLTKVQEALAKSADPVRKQQAAGWKVYRAAEPFQNSTLYISVMDPAVKDANYNVFSILQEAYGDAAAREIFEKFRNAHAGGQNVSNVTPVFLMTTGKIAVSKAP